MGVYLLLELFLMLVLLSLLVLSVREYFHRVFLTRHYDSCLPSVVWNLDYHFIKDGPVVVNDTICPAVHVLGT